MRKLTILLTFLAFSTLLVTCGSVNHANAHTMQWGFPTEPNYTPPSIVIHSPIPGMNNNSTVKLDLTIIKPDDFRGSVVSAYYTLTNRTGKQIVYINLNDNQTRYGIIGVLNYSSQLGPLEAGKYTLKVNLKIESYYLQYISGEWNFASKSVMVDAESALITFNVFSPPSPTPAPTETALSQTENQPTLNPIDYLLPISALTVVIVAIALLYRSRKKPVNVTQ